MLYVHVLTSFQLLDDMWINKVVFLLYISQNLIMACFAVFERIKLHQIFTAASISPARLTHAFVSFPFKSLARFLLI